MHQTGVVPGLDESKIDLKGRLGPGQVGYDSRASDTGAERQQRDGEGGRELVGFTAREGERAGCEMIAQAGVDGGSGADDCVC